MLRRMRFFHAGTISEQINTADTLFTAYGLDI